MKAIFRRAKPILKHKKARPILIIAVIAILGGLVVTLTQASGVFISLEPEQGSASDTSMVIDNNSASGGRYVQFKQEGCSAQSNCTSEGGPPPINTVGTSGNLISRSCSNLAPGTYQNINCTDSVILQSSGDYTFINVKMPSIKSQGGGPLFPRSGKVILDHVESGGLWFENNGSTGGQTNWTIKWSKLYGGVWQALRPKGAGKIYVSDSWLLSDGTPPDGAHTEVLQQMYGSDGHYERVAFSRQPVTNNTVTAVLTMENANDGGDTKFIDCVVGYWNGSRWVRGGGNYAVYPGKSQWIRPTIYASEASAWYQQPSVLTEPTYK